MGQIALYSLRFEPIYEYQVWGGRRLAALLTGSLRGLLWDGRQSDWRGTPRLAGFLVAGSRRRPAGSKGVTPMISGIQNCE